MLVAALAVSHCRTLSNIADPFRLTLIPRLVLIQGIPLLPITSLAWCFKRQGQLCLYVCVYSPIQVFD
jgi:hypothetical protein